MFFLCIASGWFQYVMYLTLVLLVYVCKSVFNYVCSFKMTKFV